MRTKSLLSLGLAAIMGMAMASRADAYPARGAEPAEGCRACHVNTEFRGKLSVKMLRVKDGKQIVDDYNPMTNTIFIPVHPGGKVSYKFVLGAKEGGKAKAVGWLWKLPAGVETELPNCVRKLEQGQPWTKYTDTDGQEKDVKFHTVAGQTFFFSGAVSDQPMIGELRVALGKDSMGPEALAGHTIKVIFVPAAGE
ncbi:MAG: hypothetical protein HY751_00810 [Nitrospinae bacterium]|nr:hypothetical protein [Nitrospinota bacterium]